MKNLATVNRCHDAGSVGECASAVAGALHWDASAQSESEPTAGGI